MRFLVLSVLAQAISVSGLGILNFRDQSSIPAALLTAPPVPAATTTSTSRNGVLKEGTKIHVGSGCILINSAVTLCKSDEKNQDLYKPYYSGPYTLVDDETASVVIHSKFNGDNHTAILVEAGCKLEANWPSYYGDLEFFDDCLFDRTRKYLQCCPEEQKTQTDIPNPYFLYERRYDSRYN
ncbi:uncharacterized protein N7479_000508 [Penicillium vulpinum]|uniref:Uncharacterized protein n=1 Tax=Penicillium vulpinum TaxID=29845 RepID=A0A1V6S4W1_9EURO|nr:uncharacterized protein N7479_000508 [Penicillium vulpinum]KAJ5970590.1 hypothetical protein N7479_000508 [Penicillium vulpinum]OQE09081.1 hypothetical protein PENVUL_c007G09970 [Penicillium vulpinum]